MKEIRPTNEDMRELLTGNLQARLELRVITLSRELAAAFARIDELEAKGCSCGKAE